MLRCHSYIGFMHMEEQRGWEAGEVLKSLYRGGQAIKRETNFYGDGV